MKRAVVMFLDGLRRDFITEHQTPYLHAFAATAERFAAHRSVFPSATRVVGSSVATGCYPSRHGLQGNSLALMENDALVVHDAGLPEFLLHKRKVTGAALTVPTLAQRVACHGGAIVFSNVSPGAAYVHDPDGYGHVYHRAGSFAPGRVPAERPLDVALDIAGDRAMTERFVTEALGATGPVLALLWTGEPDHIQHCVEMGSPEHLAVLAQVDHLAGTVIDAVAAMRGRGEDVLLMIGSDHGHETVVGVVDIDAELVATGLKAGRDSGDVVTVANGTASLIYLHPDHLDRREALGNFLRSRTWAGRVLDSAALGEVGQSTANGLAFAVSLRADDTPNAFGIRGSALAAMPRGGKPDRMGCGQHGGLSAFEQAPFLMVQGTGFAPGAERASPSSAVDIAPTVLAHLDLPLSGMDGRSLQPAPVT
jgi:Type I phosphodiesterase / nucleotide pyrophosphatase